MSNKKVLFNSSGNHSDQLLAIGTPNTGVTATHHGTSRNITTILTFTNLTIGLVDPTGNTAIGKTLYTFPAGYHLHIGTYYTIALGYAGANTNSKVGIGSVIAAEASTVLNGTSTFIDYVTETTLTTGNPIGSAVIRQSVATAGVLTGISNNLSGSSKIVVLNVAAAWPQPENVIATGSVTLNWIKMS